MRGSDRKEKKYFMNILLNSIINLIFYYIIEQIYNYIFRNKLKAVSFDFIETLQSFFKRQRVKFSHNHRYFWSKLNSNIHDHRWSIKMLKAKICKKLLFNMKKRLKKEKWEKKKKNVFSSENIICSELFLSKF